MPEIIDLRKKSENVQPKLEPAVVKPEPKKEVPPEIKHPAPVIPSPVQTAIINKKEDRRISWMANHSQRTNEKKSLYVFILILWIIAGLFLFIGKDTLLAILLVLTSIVLFLNSYRTHGILKIEMDRHGVTVDDRLYDYKELKSFWIEYSPQEKELRFESKKWYMPYLTLSIEKKNPLEIRSLLLDYLPEKRYEKSLLDNIMKKAGL